MKAPAVLSPVQRSPVPAELWLIRHAEVEEQYHRVFGGRIDMALSPRGNQQAAALAKYLRHTDFAALYASPMQRVQQTLAPLLVNGMPKPIILPDLREVDFGDWTGLRFEEIEAKYGVAISAWLDELQAGTIPNAERVQDIRTRIQGCLRRILKEYSGGRVAVACHGGVIRCVLAVLLELPLSQMASFEIDYASVTQVLLLQPGVRVQLLNYTPWKESRKLE